MTKRTARVKRETSETRVEIGLNVDGTRELDIQTGLGFLDHMLTALAWHANWDLSLKIAGDLHIDDHHTVEDCGLALGKAIDTALGEKGGINRFGSKYAPLDESLARAVIDFSGRPAAVINLGLRREMLGEVACENLSHFFQSLASTGKFAIHLDVLRGENDHHRVESAFKASALAFREALAITSLPSLVPSTKGVL